MRAPLAAAAIVIAASACSTDLPLLHPSLTAGQILALPAKAGVNNAHYQSTFTGTDGTVYQALGGTVQLKPERALTRIASAGGKGGSLMPEYREVGGLAYNQAFPGWSHSRWMAYPLPAGPGDPIYFDTWSGLGQMVVEGQEGSALDRVWRLVAHPPTFGPATVALRIWVRQRDGYPLKYQLDSPKGRQDIVFDRFNGNHRVASPPPADLLPPPANVADAGSYRWSGGSIRVLALDRRYSGPLIGAPDAGSHSVGVEVYVDIPNAQIAPDSSRWELLTADGAPHRASNASPGASFGKGGAGDQLAFFSVPDADQGPFSLHVVLVDQPQSVPPPNEPSGIPPQQPASNVVLDTVIRLS